MVQSITVPPAMIRYGDIILMGRPVHSGDEIRIPKIKKRRNAYMKCHKFFAWATVVCFIMTMVTGYQKR